MSQPEKCILCHGAGTMPVLTEEQSAARDAPIDEIAEATIARIMYGIPQDPMDEKPRPSLATRSDAQEIHDFLLGELGGMLGAMAIAKLKAMGIDPKTLGQEP